MIKLIPFENWHVEIELHLPGVENAAARIIHLKTFNWGKPTMWKCHKAMDIFRTPLSPPPPRHLRTLRGVFYRYIGRSELKFAVLSLI